MKFPQISDASRQKMFRTAYYMQMCVLFGYAVCSRLFFYFERSNLLLLAMMLWAVFLELAIQHHRGKKLYFPVSAIIASLGCSIIIDATSWIPYIAAVTLAICSKFFITDKNGRHIFNPSNFGVVCVLLLYFGNINLWGVIYAGSWIFSAVFFTLGFIIVIMAGQAQTSLFWIFNFALVAFFRSGFSGELFLMNLKVLGSVAMLLFTFNMITDPRTSPQTAKARFIYTLAIALIDAGFRQIFIPYGNFYGLFLVSSLIPIFYAKK